MHIVKYARDPLYKNSVFMMLSSVTNAGFGFFFWMIAARLYSAEDVGLASLRFCYGFEWNAVFSWF